MNYLVKQSFHEALTEKLNLVKNLHLFSTQRAKKKNSVKWINYNESKLLKLYLMKC
jgi:hypothetical protein